MTSRERLLRVLKGEIPDRVPFIPTIFEHSAKLIDRTPSEAALDEKLLEEAQIKAYQIYGHDALNVGIDVYNIEAEALGCEVRYYKDNSIPGILSHPYEEEADFDSITFSLERGRIKSILNAAEKINKELGSEVGVSIGICGPFSIAVELIGYENIIFEGINDSGRVHRLLEATLKYQKGYCDEIIKRGLGITIFESWATPPLVSPDTYREFIKCYEKELISYIKGKGISAAPLVIGGDTGLILDDIIETGTTILIADYKADLETFILKASVMDIPVRGNIDPKIVQNGTKEEIINQIKIIEKKVKGYKKFILGTGVIPYDTPYENILLIKDYLETGGRS